MPRYAMFLTTLAMLPAVLAPLALLDARQAQPAKGKWPKEIKNSVGMKLLRIPGGKFKMGSPADEKDRSTDEEQHEVEITKDFWVGEHEVTQGQFKAVMGFNPSYFSRSGKGNAGVEYGSEPAGGKETVPEDTKDFPVENVSWKEAKEFCEQLTKKEGAARKYRLPTEAEWEYACRGGATSYQIFHFGDTLSSTQANFCGEYPYGETEKGVDLRRPCKVRLYKKNGFGLYDMHGNVWEWCSDWYDKDYYGKSLRRDPEGPSEGSFRVVRGGSFGSIGKGCRSAIRLKDSPGARGVNLGFRVALVPLGK